MQLNNRLKRLEASKSGVLVLIEDEEFPRLNKAETAAYMRQVNPRGLPVVMLEPQVAKL